VGGELSFAWRACPVPMAAASRVCVEDVAGAFGRDAQDI
jgi:hypothetical protein